MSASAGQGAPVRILVTGITGRMGTALGRMARADSDLILVGGTERKGSPAVGTEVAGVKVHEDLRAAIEEARPQVVIDFTSAEASVQHAKICAEKGVALVVGSTGFTNEARAEVMLQARRVPVVMAPNMSVGVNLVIKMAADLARLLGDGYDIEIVEAHHRMKKDAPSGTALRMAEDIARAIGRTPADFRMAREGQVGERPAKEIGIQTVRGGDVVGEHTVFFFGEGERVELTHRATNRDQFARGALRAARWVVGRVPGQYDMQDVLGLR